ncbi:hypothetical protein FFZ99_12430 [Leptospira interrogans]|nr:hypothetical protein BW243_07525 [Leptospira interrogans serovar Pomona]TQE52824.1 hypothetical protein FF006_18160 [Leptospira interrogans]TQE62161.1 hypothetical protein FFZ99_12430 [Leptospira interrogans]TQE67112.1 hypothetical protein FF001_08135 [Leptospira interrogans]TQE72379.1 hypothetical protein FF002_12560 [Leptospira interrogans]
MKLCFALIPTFKESICKVQITAFFEKVNHERTHVINFQDGTIEMSSFLGKRIRGLKSVFQISNS